MAKTDFCFTFYDGDASRDMSHMNRLERGAYTDVMISQRKFGRLSLLMIKKTLGKDYESVWESLEMVLKKEEDKYFIEWLDVSIEKMKNQSLHQSENGKKGGRPKAIVINPSESQTKAELNPNESQTKPKQKPLEDEDGYGIKTKEVSEILWTDVVQKLKTDYLWKEKFCRDKDVRSKAFDDQLQEFLNELELKEDFKEIRDVKSHFLHWFNKNRTKKTSFTDHDFKTIPFKKIV